MQEISLNSNWKFYNLCRFINNHNIDARSHFSFNVHGGAFFISTFNDCERAFIFFRDITPKPTLSMRAHVNMRTLKTAMRENRNETPIRLAYNSRHKTVNVFRTTNQYRVKLKDDDFTNYAPETKYVFSIQPEVFLGFNLVRHTEYYARKYAFFYNNGYFCENDRRYIYKYRYPDLTDEMLLLPESILKLASQNELEHIHIYKCIDYDYQLLIKSRLVDSNIDILSFHNIRNVRIAFDDTLTEELLRFRLNPEPVLELLDKCTEEIRFIFQDNKMIVEEYFSNQSEFLKVGEFNIDTHVEKPLTLTFAALMVVKKIFRLAAMREIDAIHIHTRTFNEFQNHIRTQEYFEYRSEDESFYLISDYKINEK